MSTPNDRMILNSVVNPLLPIGEAVYDEKEEQDEHVVDGVDENDEDLRESVRLELEAVKLCEKGEMTKALEMLNDVKKISVAKSKTRTSSILNNRAQVKRLLGDSIGAKSDLDEAISLSGGVGRAAKMAYCQRGLLLRRDGQDDEAMLDFKRAADLGSGFAKSILAQLNPYAAMCNKMLKNVFQALESGAEEVENPFKDVQSPSG